jgi:hypothetical protein
MDEVLARPVEITPITRSSNQQRLPIPTGHILVATARSSSFASPEKKQDGILPLFPIMTGGPEANTQLYMNGQTVGKGAGTIFSVGSRLCDRDPAI